MIPRRFAAVLRRSAVAGAFILSVGCTSTPTPRTRPPEQASPPTVSEPKVDLQFLGMAILPGRMRYRDTPVGGLSGIRFDAPLHSYLTVSDDPSERGPARVYRMEIRTPQGMLKNDDLQVTDLIPLRRADGSEYPRDTVDPEGIAVARDGSFYISSEGNVGRGIGPFVRHFAADGAFIGELPIPQRFLPDRTGRRGIRQNTAFEALSLSPDGHRLFVGTESALIQDGPANSMDQDSPARLLVFDLDSGDEIAEYVYMVGRVRQKPTTPRGLMVTGLTELLALDDTHLLALERSWVEGRGNRVELQQIDLSGATDVSSIDALAPAVMESLRSVRKHTLLDFGSLGVRVDNLEGMTFGPTLADGRRLLLVISDNNFNWISQVSEFLAFSVDIRRAAR